MKKQLHRTLSQWLKSNNGTMNTVESTVTLPNDTRSPTSPAPNTLPTISNALGFDLEFDLFELECNKELAKAVRKQLHEIEKAQVTDSSVNLDQQVKQLKNRLSELLVQIQEREARTRGFVG